MVQCTCHSIFFVTYLFAGQCRKMKLLVILNGIITYEVKRQQFKKKTKQLNHTINEKNYKISYDSNL